MEFDADLIDDRIWLGSFDAMKNTIALDQMHITHILSLIDLTLEIDENEQFIRKHIHVEDLGTTDLLNVFESCYNFIDNALSEDPSNNVLIHCQAGASRSATIACMWLMRRYNLSANDALKRLRLARPSVNPNLGFCAQLYVFEQMNNKLDANHGLYKEFHFERARSIYIDHDTENEGINKKNDLRQKYRQAFTLPYGHATCTVTETYTCCQCQTELFTNADVSRHTEGTGLHDWFRKYAVIQSSNVLPEVECHQQLFTHCLEWLICQIDTPENSHSGSIKCLKCSETIGNYDLSGAKCSCGRWVVPAFRFNTNKVEQKKVATVIIETKTVSS